MLVAGIQPQGIDRSGTAQGRLPKALLRHRACGSIRPGPAGGAVMGETVKNQPEQLYIVVPPGFEELCAGELAGLGLAVEAGETGGLSLSGGLRELYLVNLWLRCASRVLVRVGEFKTRDFPDLYRKCGRVAWGRFIRPGQPLQVRVTARRSRLSHTGRIAATTAEAIRHALGGVADRADLPPATLLVHVTDDRCRLSIDSSGELLHRRGYRRRAVPAPLRENLAAGLLLRTGWDGREPFLDPFCGSGTLAIEAALLAAGRPPGAGRRFAFMDWPGYREGLWQALLLEARKRERPVPVPLYASDSSAEAVASARENARNAGVDSLIHWQVADATRMAAPGPRGLLLGNPPYGERLGERSTLGSWYARLGEHLIRHFPGWRQALLVADRQLLDSWPGELRSLLRFRNGGLAVELLAGNGEFPCFHRRTSL